MTRADSVSYDSDMPANKKAVTKDVVSVRMSPVVLGHLDEMVSSDKPDVPNTNRSTFVERLVLAECERRRGR